MLGGVCPRCGERYSYIDVRVRGGRVYYYAVHYYREGSRRRVRKCYLGPREYVYASLTHAREGLRFRGLVDPMRVLDYLEAIVGFLERVGVPEPRRREAAERLRRLADRLDPGG